MIIERFVTDARSAANPTPGLAGDAVRVCPRRGLTGVRRWLVARWMFQGWAAARGARSQWWRCDRGPDVQAGPGARSKAKGPGRAHGRSGGGGRGAATASRATHV